MGLVTTVYVHESLLKETEDLVRGTSMRVKVAPMVDKDGWFVTTCIEDDSDEKERESGTPQPFDTELGKGICVFCLIDY